MKPPLIRIVCCRCASDPHKREACAPVHHLDVAPVAVASADEFSNALEPHGWKALVKMDRDSMILRPVCPACYQAVCEAPDRARELLARGG